MKRRLLLVILLLNIFVIVYSEDNFNNYLIDLSSKNYYLCDYFNTLKDEDRNSLKKKFPENTSFNDTVWEEIDGGIIHKWYEENFFTFERIKTIMTLSNTISNNRLKIGRDIVIDINELNKQNNLTIVGFKEVHYKDEEKYYKTLIDWKILRQTNSNTLVFIEDGDYLNIYYDKDKLIPFATFAKMNDETLEQFKSLIYTNKCDLSKVTWPRHADGTCDYDGSSKKVTTAKTSQSKTSEAIKAGSNTNVTVNKTLTTNCNLKLRSGEATSTQVLTVMSAGTKVKILELGKAETIDGIKSNWVKVEVQKGAKDRDGKAIKAGTVGWCYGGYLE